MCLLSTYVQRLRTKAVSSVVYNSKTHLAAFQLNPQCHWVPLTALHVPLLVLDRHPISSSSSELFLLLLPRLSNLSAPKPTLSKDLPIIWHTLRHKWLIQGEFYPTGIFLFLQKINVSWLHLKFQVPCE